MCTQFKIAGTNRNVTPHLLCVTSPAHRCPPQKLSSYSPRTRKPYLFLPRKVQYRALCYPPALPLSKSTIQIFDALSDSSQPCISILSPRFSIGRTKRHATLWILKFWPLAPAKSISGSRRSACSALNSLEYFKINGRYYRRACVCRCAH